MKSKWFELKTEALILRKKGKSIKHINSKLGIPLSTLSGWFKNVRLTDSQKAILKRKWERALIKARREALKWHHAEKQKRLKNAEEEAEKTLSKIQFSPEIVELALSLLYLGEGAKKSINTMMGNSDPLILKFFLKTMTTIFNLDVKQMRFDLHLRSDQDPEKIKRYWSKELNVPINRFLGVSIDKRTAGSKTFSSYKGVCVVHCGHVAIQRKLVYIGRKFCEQITTSAISSLGRATH